MKKINKVNISILVVFFLFLLINFSINLDGFGDDGTLFLNPLQESFDGSMVLFLRDRYIHWSSRIIIEFFTLLSVKYPLLWRILNTLAMTTAVVSPIFLFKFKEKKWSLIFVSFFLFLLIPKSMFSETGWIATTTNYLWVLASLLGFLGIALAKNNRWYTYILSLILVLYAGNLEQMNIVLLIVIPVIFVLFKKSKKNYMQLIPHFLLTLGNLSLILISPGNKTRFEIEVSNRFTDFESLTFFRKLELGFSSTYKFLYLNNQFVFLFLALLICIALMNNSKLLINLAAFIPMMIFVIFSLFADYFSKLLPIVEYIFTSFNNYGTIFQFMHPITWLADLLLLLTTGSILLAIVYIFKEDIPKVILLFFILALGLITRLIMGFSPTIWASASRTSLFLFFCVNITSLLIIDEKNSSFRVRSILIVFGSILYFNYFI
ncbi:DUF6056 family protein [uncultured Rummeliibacillus sp.]|mgnify:CR=1 FL=1|uniref:DUF6056 family protein n=1 Tax=uncultured Rummeliibacillus sp. TaxID=762292 RepID=UPI002638EE30|nr:DUF6056 family protein [uncultured Rummeliibacillus sp.]